MNDNNLKISVIASLNTGLSIKEINTQLKAIEKHPSLQKLKLKIEIDDRITKTLNDFSKQMSKLGDVAKNTGKIIQENIAPDGSRSKTTYFNGLKGEFSKIDTVAKQTGDKQVKYLNQVKDKYAEVTKVVEKYNAEQNKLGTKVTLSNGNNTRNVNLDANNQVTGYTDTTNRAKDLQQTQQLIADKQKLRQELVKLGEQGNVTAQQLANVAKSVNGAKDISGIQQAKTSYAQLADQAKLAEQMAQGRENASLNRMKLESNATLAQQKAINSNNDLTRQQMQQGKELEAEIKRRIELYQKEKQIQSQNLQTRFGSNLNKSALSSQMSNVMNVNPNQFGSLKELSNWQQEANNGFKEISANANAATSKALSFGDALKTAFSSFGIWMVSGTALMQSLNFFKDGITFVNELNKSLTEISIVTGQNQQQVASLGESYNKLAQNMGVTTNEIGKTAAGLYRQGLSAEEASKRMQTVIEYAKISSLDINVAAEIMTAAINSMGVSATRAADVWSYMGDATATGADEIGKAMQKVGGTAGALDINFEKVSSWVSVISSKTRESAETIGQSVKSIMARIQSMKEKGFDETDGTKVNQVAKALDAVGIKLMDNQGQFRNFGKVMDELGAKWKTLDSRQKAYISTTVAGKIKSAA